MCGRGKLSVTDAVFDFPLTLSHWSFILNFVQKDSYLIGMLKVQHIIMSVILSQRPKSVLLLH